MTPAFLIYFQSFRNSEAGLAAAIAVLLLLVIMVFTLVQRRMIGSRGDL